MKEALHSSAYLEIVHRPGGGGSGETEFKHMNGAGNFAPRDSRKLLVNIAS